MMPTSTLRRLSTLCDELERSLRGRSTPIPDSVSVEDWAQALIHARLAWRIAAPRLQNSSVLDSLLDDSPLAHVLRMACTATPDSLLANVDAIAADKQQRESTAKRDFDQFLGTHDRRSRARWGVYFTPPEIARFVVREIDRLLVAEFDANDGLADKRVTIHDPACGTGVFLLAAVDHLAAAFVNRHHELGTAAWNSFVGHSLLPRLTGSDILLPACAVAWIRVADKLAASGYRFESPVPIGIEQRNTLEPSPPVRPSRITTGKLPVLLGNPPFSALTTSSNDWVDGLLKVTTLHGRAVGGYFEVDGQPLAERKLWLHDDYVKFLRVAQDRVEAAGSGIVAFVTNHGYLDNVTFRGVRNSLLKSFSRITILDLHGNRKKRELPPQGISDENVFPIDQGVAISFLRKLECVADRGAINDLPSAHHGSWLRGDLWGRRVDKLRILGQADDGLARQRWTPAAPYFFFAPPRGSQQHSAEYTRGIPLHEAMPANSTAVVTARDRFVVGFSQEELLDRFAALCDDSQSDDDLRMRYFQHTRSRRYPRGDSRGWQLATARATARRCPDPRALLRRCAYRPFDSRWVLWADWLIDWPRTDLSQHLFSGDNLALVARRQMPVDEPSNYFFVADAPVIDGLIRSDNRGSESFFPLFVTNSAGDRAPNYSKSFWELVRNVVPEVVAEPLLFMIYAQFHSPEYRRRFQVELSLDFPRVFMPRSRALFHDLAELGRQLVELHLLRRPWPSSSPAVPNLISERSTTIIPPRGFPNFESGALHISPNECLGDASAAAWDFRIGAHQVLRKWLRDRAGQPLTTETRDRYRQILCAVEQTNRLLPEIDRAIETRGGWPAAFA